MTEPTNDGSIVAETSNRFEMSKRANEHRKNGELEKALPLYRELAKDDSDSYSAAGLLHCLRKLHLFDEALALCIPANPRHLALDWYRNEVIWTRIQGELNRTNEKTPIQEIESIAQSILMLEPEESTAKWAIVRRVLKAAKSRKRWDIVSTWIERVHPEELSTVPMKDNTGRDGWCDQALWHYLKIRSMIEVGDKTKAVSFAQNATNLFPKQQKFFRRLEALAHLRLGTLAEAERLYSTLYRGGSADWWILHEHAQVLRDLGKDEEALTAMCKAALSNNKSELLVALFSDIGFLCLNTERKEDARNHLKLCALIREEKNWSVPQIVSSTILVLEKELVESPAPPDLNAALAACQKFWRKTVGAQYDSREPSLKSRGVKRMLKGKLKMGPLERPYCFLLSDGTGSYFCRKSDLPTGIADGVMLQFDAIPSFDRKKNQESWKAINMRRFSGRNGEKA